LATAAAVHQLGWPAQPAAFGVEEGREMMTADEIKLQVDLVGYIRSCGVELKKNGSRDLIGLCPFHADTEPSLSVTPSKCLWHCLSCEAGGSVIDFAMLRHGWTLKQALQALSELKFESRNSQTGTNSNHLAGNVGNGQGSAAAAVLSPERANQLLERAVSLYERTFSDVPEGRAYLDSRGISDAGLFSRHRLGYCNGRLPEILPPDGPIWDELTSLGILLDSRQERFTGCVVAPVFDAEGSFSTLYGRFTGAEERKGHLFLPDRSTGTWNAAAAKTYGELIVVESVIDALSCQMAGFDNVVAIQGTNGLRDSDLAMLSDCGVRSLILVLDGDEAGQEATARLQQRLSSFSCEVRTLPADHDPNSFLQAHGAQGLAELLAADSARPAAASTDPPHSAAVASARCVSGAKSAVETQSGSEEKEKSLEGGSGEPNEVRRAARSGGREQSDRQRLSPERLPPSSSGNVVGIPDGFAVLYGVRRYEVHGLEKGTRKLKATVRVEHAGKLHVDTLDLYSARSRRSLCQDLARVLEQCTETIEADLTRLIVECERFDPALAKSAASEPESVQRMTAEEKKAALAFGRDPLLIERILADYERCGLVGERHNKLLCYLAAVSRKMDEPLSVLILSSSGAGKTALQDATLAFCPAEDVVKLTSLSGKALF